MELNQGLCGEVQHRLGSISGHTAGCALASLSNYNLDLPEPSSEWTRKMCRKGT